MRKNFNKILKGISVDDVQIDNYDNDTPITRNEAVAVETVEVAQLESNAMEVDNFDNASSNTLVKKRGRKKKEVAFTKVNGRRFRGKDYTSTRIRKDQMTLLRLLFEEMTSVEIMELLIAQYLEQNQNVGTLLLCGMS